MSFQKRIDSSLTITGTKTKNNLNLVSAGIPSLDHLIGGGLPSGSIFLVEEDVLGNYSRVMCKYFLAEGLVCKHILFAASADDDPCEMVKELPTATTTQSDEEVPALTSDVDKMKIAWRYEGLGQVESSFGSNTNFGNHFDLSKHVSEETIKNANISYWTSGETKEKHGDSFKNQMYANLLKQIKQRISEEGSKPDNILKICVQSLGSPVWTAYDEDDELNYSQDLIKFFYCLRAAVRDTNCVIYVTVPTHLFDDATLVKRILYSVDNAVLLESFAGSSRETNPVYKDYHGLFHITKISAMNSLVAYVPPSLDLAFKLRRKKFTIEKLHLPPELEESSEREQDDITATPLTCAGIKKKNIDF